MQSLFWKVTVAAFWVANGSTAAQAASSISGALRGDYFQSTRTLDSKTNLVGATAQLKATLRPRENTALKFEARTTNASIDRRGHSDARLVESYVAVQGPRWDWRIGKQIIAWGRADAINPTDVIGPRDYTVLLPFDEDQRLGSWAAVGNYAWSPQATLSMLWKADFEPSIIAVPTVDRNAHQFVQPESKTSQLGLRLNHAGSDVDWSVSLFRGYSLLPQAGPDQAANGSALRLTYPAITMVGVDAAKNFSAFGTRFEIAYVDPDRSARPDEPGLRRNLYLVAGVDHTFFPRLNVNVQLFFRRSWDLPGRLDARFTAAQSFNASNFMQQRKDVEGLTLRISNTWFHDTLEAEVFVQRFFLDGDAFVQPMVTYAFSDAVQGTIGGQYYRGSGAQFGLMKRNRGTFVEMRYSF